MLNFDGKSEDPKLLRNISNKRSRRRKISLIKNKTITKNIEYYYLFLIRETIFQYKKIITKHPQASNRAYNL